MSKNLETLHNVEKIPEIISGSLDVTFSNTGTGILATNIQDAIAELDNTKLTANTAITAGTGTKITYDAKGLVTGSTTLSASDVPILNQDTTGSSGSCTGNAATATKLATAITINDVSFDGTANITVADSTKLPLTGGTLTGALTAIRETKVGLSSNNIDLATGNLFTKTITGATTFTVSNVLSSGNANSFILELTNGGAFIITWWSGVKWAGGTAPTLTSEGVDILGFYSHDGGTTWRGMVLAKDSK